MTASEDEREDTTIVDGHAASVQQLPDPPDNGDEPPVNGTGNDKPTEDGDDAGKPKSKPKKKTPFWLELIILVAIAFVLTFLIQTFIARVFSIPSESMEQTLNGCTGCTGDRILVDKLTYDFTDPSPGDVIVFKGPPGWAQNEYVSQGSSNPVVQWFRELGSSIGIGSPPEYDLVKRVVAVGGETVYCCDANNHVVVNGKPLVEPYVYFQPGMPNQAVPSQQNDPTPNDNKVGEQASFPTITVPKGYLLVMGDNRNNSDDSRYQNGGGQAGLVPVGDVIGKARTIIWPPSRWRGIGDYNAQTGALDAPGWSQEAPLAVGFAGAFPVFWLGKRARRGIRRAAGRRTDK
ncbi:MAG TPA: signal peptidase I [Pseudonocardiaceae bacterium]|nr:signal peptidase I [Pseudonocardiaceae bacterium]